MFFPLIPVALIDLSIILLESALPSLQVVDEFPRIDPIVGSLRALLLAVLVEVPLENSILRYEHTQTLLDVQVLPGIYCIAVSDDLEGSRL